MRFTYRGNDLSLIYVTGISGSGKSTVRRELQERGYTAYDVDEDGFRSWYNKSSDAKATEQKAWEDTTVEWRARYWLKIDRSKVEACAKAATNGTEPTFLCGTTPNDRDVSDLFDKVLHLAVSDATLRDRLATRTNNDYGKHPDDLRDILTWNATATERNVGYGATIVNAEQPLSSVVEHVLAAVGVS